MSWYHTVSPARPSDDRLRGASLLARHLWTHFLVSELATRVPGLVRGGLATIAEHIEEPPEATLMALEELRTRGAIEFDLASRVIRLVGVALEDFEIPAKSLATVAGWLRVARELPRCEVVARQAEEFAELCPSRATDWLALAARCRRLPRPAAASPEAVAHVGGPGGAPGALTIPDLDPDPDPDLDPDPPLPPKGGNEGSPVGSRVLLGDVSAELSESELIALGQPSRSVREVRTASARLPAAGLVLWTDLDKCAEMGEALEILALGREQLGLPPLPPSAREVRTAVRRLSERRALALLPTLVRRHLRNVIQGLAAGRDERSTVTLRGVTRRLDKLAVDDERARAPPPSQALASPVTDDF